MIMTLEKLMQVINGGKESSRNVQKQKCFMQKGCRMQGLWKSCLKALLQQENMHGPQIVKYQRKVSGTLLIAKNLLTPNVRPLWSLTLWMSNSSKEFTRAMVKKCSVAQEMSDSLKSMTDIIETKSTIASSPPYVQLLIFHGKSKCDIHVCNKEA